MTDIRAWLDQGRALADQATEGPWGGTWNGAREGNICGETDVLDATNVSAQDLFFITDARSRLPQALDALQAVLDLHKRSHYGNCTHTACDSGSAWPCPTIEIIQDAIGGDDA